MSSEETPGGAEYSAERLIATHQAGIWRYLRVLGCEPAEADDLTQETFLRVLQQPFREVHPSATAAYLRKTAYHLFISARRRQGRTPQLVDLEGIEEAWERWAGDSDGEGVVEALRECLQRLTPRARLALELRYRDDQSRAQIAAVLDLTEDGAKNLMQRAKHQLRACVDNKVNDHHGE